MIQPIGSMVNKVSLVSSPTTQSFSEAINSRDSDEWIKAISIERSALEKKRTWDVIKKKPWLCTRKCKPNGSLDKCEARLMANGDSHKTEQQGMSSCQFDIKSVFSKEEVDEDIYLEIPEGIAGAEDRKTKVCKLNRSLYGLKQAPCLWYQELKSALLEIGLEESLTDPCLFVSKEKDFRTACNVDDGLIFSRNEELSIHVIPRFKKKKFELTSGDRSCLVAMEMK